MRTQHFRVIIDFPIGRGWPRFVEDAVRDMACWWEGLFYDERGLLSRSVPSVIHFASDVMVGRPDGEVHNPFVAIITGFCADPNMYADFRQIIMDAVRRLQAKVHHDDTFFSKVSDRPVWCQVHFWETDQTVRNVVMNSPSAEGRE